MQPGREGAWGSLRLQEDSWAAVVQSAALPYRLPPYQNPADDQPCTLPAPPIPPPLPPAQVLFELAKHPRGARFRRLSQELEEHAAALHGPVVWKMRQWFAEPGAAPPCQLPASQRCRPPLAHCFSSLSQEQHNHGPPTHPFTHMPRAHAPRPPSPPHTHRPA
jgi:hypothetical protein